MKKKLIKMTFLPNSRSKHTRVINLKEYLNDYLPDFKHRVIEYQETGDKSIKMALPAIIPAAIMRGGHSYKKFIRPTGFASFDVDGITDSVDEVKERLKKDPHICLLMLSASGKGLWGLVHFGRGSYDMKYEALFHYMKSKHGVQLDPTGANMNRLRFVSWDDDVYWNGQARTWSQKRGTRLFKMNENGVTLDLKVKHTRILKPSEKYGIRTFNQVNTCEEILDRNGWVFVSEDHRGRKHYLRPGATSHETSGNIADGMFYCWTSSTNLKENKLYSPFDLCVALDHEWNLTKALKAISNLSLNSMYYGKSKIN
jgi:hypothetical protein